MSAVKEIIYCFVVLTTVTLSLCEVSESVSTPVAKGDCSCGGFSSPTPEAGSAPLISHAPGLVVPCDEAGEGTCKEFCLALATATRAKGPEILCAKIVDAKELKLSAFYKVCVKPWVYANMTSEEALCCEKSKAVSCPTPTTDIVNVTNVTV
ncbi:uncharacterized protein LOC121729425 [Aricia agestis]|uniref:uncharacterized protein LOC121729425 n=1 Tax=Aricia agestis TaxID=91739 RepID=UPI001C204D26|nr:uncharacterized protein LOC121729425 [Aricia agestis]